MKHAGGLKADMTSPLCAYLVHCVRGTHKRSPEGYKNRDSSQPVCKHSDRCVTVLYRQTNAQELQSDHMGLAERAVFMGPHVTSC
jgi:hypothetical protein